MVDIPRLMVNFFPMGPYVCQRKVKAAGILIQGIALRSKQDLKLGLTPQPKSRNRIIIKLAETRRLHIAVAMSIMFITFDPADLRGVGQMERLEPSYHYLF